MARGLSNEQKMKVQDLLLKKKDVDQIASETGLSKANIEDYLNKLHQSLQKVEDAKAATEKPKRNGPNAYDLMGHKTAEKQRKGVTVMTSPASQRLDEARKKMPNQNDQFKDCIHKPKG